VHDVNVLFVSAEVAPFAKTGGLGDVAGALPNYLRQAGHDVRVFMPLYSRIDLGRANFSFIGTSFDIHLGHHRYHIRIVTADTAPGTYFVHCPELYNRPGLYTQDADEHRRFLALGWAALVTAQYMGFSPDVLHCNDWHTALLPLTLKARFSWDRLFAHTKTLLTVHNLNYQGQFSSGILHDTNLSDVPHLFHQDQLREGRINFLLHGILYAGAINAVSPTYAQEIQTPAHGVGLDGYLRARAGTVVGILNGVDYNEWSPENDSHIAHRYSAADLSGKELNKEHLLTSLGLPYYQGVPLIGVVSRLVGQKGFELLEHVMPDLLYHRGFQLVALGSGESRLEAMFARFQRLFPRQVCFWRGFSNPLAHMIEAGADMFLMPSRYEPCGLNQMYSLKYGTVPIVHRTGGLADSVEPWNPATGRGTGFVFDHHDGTGVRWAIEAALNTWEHPDSWRLLVQNGMARDFSWERQTRLYEMLYSRIP
jgi:starch synthase